MMSSKYCSSYLFSFCVCCISFASLRAQTCPFKASGNITNGIIAELIRTDSEFLLGIRVSWSWLSSEPIQCFQSPEVSLSTNTGSLSKTLSFISRNNSVEFLNLDCNQMYTPRVIAIFGGQVQLYENGNTLFFGSSERSPPQVLPQVCVGPSTSPEHRTRVNISWNLLPCHLQNGADITSYIILYTRLSTNVTTRISSSSRNVECSPEFGGLYSCVVATLLIPNDQAFSIQVAARNNNGDGSFSDPMNISTPVSNTTCTSPSNTDDSGLISITSIPPDASSVSNGGLISTTSIPLDTSDGGLISTSSISLDASSDTDGGLIRTTSMYLESDVTDATNLNPESSQNNYTSYYVWALMGSLVAVIAITAGIVILVQSIINYTLWKRLRNLKKHQALQQRSTLVCEKIDMKECSAYGQVISPQTVTEQPHIYEATT